MAATKDPTKNTAPVSDALVIAGAPDARDWEKEETGFAPYWTPGEGKVFFGRVTGRDERDPDFVRYSIQLEQDSLECHTGPKEDQTPITVRKGDTFNVSVYVQLDKLFNEYMECGLFPVMRIQSLKEAKTSTAGQTCWIFDLRVSPADRKALKTYRAEKAKVMAEARSERQAMQA